MLPILSYLLKAVWIKPKVQGQTTWLCLSLCTGGKGHTFLGLERGSGNQLWKMVFEMVVSISIGKGDFPPQTHGKWVLGVGGPGFWHVLLGSGKNAVCQVLSRCPPTPGRASVGLASPGLLLWLSEGLLLVTGSTLPGRHVPRGPECCRPVSALASSWAISLVRDPELHRGSSPGWHSPQNTRCSVYPPSCPAPRNSLPVSPVSAPFVVSHTWPAWCINPHSRVLLLGHIGIRRRRYWVGVRVGKNVCSGVWPTCDLLQFLCDRLFVCEAFPEFLKCSKPRFAHL